MKIDSPNAIGVIAGFGVPTGGTSGQVLQKVNATNYNTQWVDGRPSTVGVQWSNSYGSAYANPTSTGGTLSGTASWLNNTQGVRLTAAAVGQFGAVNWTLNNFDFTRDFKASFMTFYNAAVNTGAAGDGHFFNFGGNGGSSTTYAVADGSLSVAYDPYSGAMNTRAWVNGTVVGDRPLFNAGIISAVWVMWTIQVQRNMTNNKKEVSIYCNNHLQLVADINTWAPTGKVFSVGAWTGGAFCEQFLYSAKIEYI